jgi:hypothetical protein
MVDRLTVFLDLATLVSESHCGFWLADWCAFATGEDPALRYRGTSYPTDDVLGIVSTIALDAGLERVVVPVRGDVGVIEISGETFCAIYAGRRWMLLAERGLTGILDRFVTVRRAWRVCLRP